MKMLTFLLLSLLAIQDEAPYKPSEEFELKLDFEFKDRGAGRNPNKIDMDLTMKEYEKTKGSGLLPYLWLNLKVLKQQENEVRLKVIENKARNILNKKVDTSTIVKLELGFTDDIKDRVGPYEYTIIFVNGDKDPVSRITIFFEKDGTYLVNGQMRGKI